jgi:membrane-associated phospholipid phosphatase
MRKLVQAIVQLELFEVVGLTASLAAIIIFVSHVREFDTFYGVHMFDIHILNAVIGVFENPMPWLFVGTMTLLAGLYLVIRWRRPHTSATLLYLIRIMMAFVVLMAIYKTVNFYIAVFNPFDRDAAIQQIDKNLFFGKLPSVWLEPYISKPLTYLFSGAYVSWFILTYATVLVMLRAGREAMRQYVSTALLTFYIGYFTYFLVPVIGPMYTVAYARHIGGITAFFAHDAALIARDCFPSLHTGISIVMAIIVWRYRRRFAWLYIPMAGLIISATIYLRIHYALDVFAGASLAVAMAQLTPMILRAWALMQERAFAGLTSLKGSSLGTEGVLSELTVQASPKL